MQSELGFSSRMIFSVENVVFVITMIAISPYLRFDGFSIRGRHLCLA